MTDALPQDPRLNLLVDLAQRVTQQYVNLANAVHARVDETMQAELVAEVRRVTGEIGDALGEIIGAGESTVRTMYLDRESAKAFGATLSPAVPTVTIPWEQP